MIWLVSLKLKGGKCLAVFFYSFITYPDVIGLTGCEWCHIMCTYFFSWIFLWPWSFYLDRMWVMSYLIQLCPLTFLTSHLNLLILQGVRNSMPGSDVSFLISLIPMFVILIFQRVSDFTLDLTCLISSLWHLLPWFYWPDRKWAIPWQAHLMSSDSPHFPSGFVELIASE